MKTLALVPAVAAAAAVAKKSHARLSPSKAHRWIPCPGSMHVVAEDPETEWAAEGTRKHAVLALVLSPQNDVDKNGKLIVAGDVIETECGPYVVPLEVLEQCYEIRDFIQQFKDTHKDEWVVETETHVEIGTHVWPGMTPGECAGTTDATAYSFDELLVLDAKFGFVQVHPRGNPQLMLYALGLVAEIPLPIRWVTLCIAQPGWDGLVEFREHRVTVDELRAWALEVQSVVEEIRAKSYRLQADDHACRYCPARTQCPARLKALDDAAHEGWMEERSLEELLPVVPRLRAICKDIEQRAMAEMNAGREVRGWKLVAAKSRRKWADEAAVAPAMSAATGLPASAADFYDTTLKSPAQMEKVLRAVKKMTVKDAKALINTVAFQPEGGPKLAPASDPRPALEAAKWTLEDVLKASLEDFNGDE